MELKVKFFSALSAKELHDIYRLRVSVFVVEQRCPYQEVDDADERAYHVWLEEDGAIRAYLRVLEPGTAFPECAIGRVIAAERRRGLGTRIVTEGLRVAQEKYGADKATTTCRRIPPARRAASRAPAAAKSAMARWPSARSSR